MPRHYAMADDCCNAVSQSEAIASNFSVMEDVFVGSGEHRFGPSGPEHDMTFSLRTIATTFQR